MGQMKPLCQGQPHEEVPAEGPEGARKSEDAVHGLTWPQWLGEETYLVTECSNKFTPPPTLKIMAVRWNHLGSLNTAQCAGCAQTQVGWNL